MSKHKPAKRARSPKIAARAQRNKQAIVRSAKDSLLRSVAASPIETPLKLHDDSKQKAPIVQNQKDPIVENRVAALKAAALEAAALPDGGSQMMRDNKPKNVFDYSLATVSMQAYQATLLEVAQANTKFAFEFSQRLATIRSPFDFFAVIAEFTSRRIDMFGKHANEMAAYPFWGIDASRELTALPGAMTSSHTAAATDGRNADHARVGHGLLPFGWASAGSRRGSGIQRPSLAL